MPPSVYYNQGTGRSYINATRIDCGTLEAGNVTANSVSSTSLTGGAQNGLGQQVVDWNANVTTSNALYVINKPNLSSFTANSVATGALTVAPSNVAQVTIGNTGQIKVQSNDPGIIAMGTVGTAGTARASLGLGTVDGGTTPNWVLGQNRGGTGSATADLYIYNWTTGQTPLVISNTCQTTTLTCNVAVAGNLSASGNISGAINASTLSASGNATLASVTAGNLTSTGNITGAVSASTLSASGNTALGSVTAGNVMAGTLTATGNISGPVNASTLSASGNATLASVSAGNVGASKVTAGNVVVTGNISAPLISLPNANFTGQYSELKGVPSGNTIAANTLSVTTNADYPISITENYSGGANGYTHALSALNPAQSTGEAFIMQVGQTAAQYGTSYLGHVNQGGLYSNNYATIGVYGQDRIVNVTGNRMVGINTTTPAYNLDVVGNIHSTGIAYANGGVQTNGCVSIGYNPSVIALLCPGVAQMGFTTFQTAPGFPCPQVTFQNAGTVSYTPLPANTVTTTLNFICNGFQASTAACIQVRDDGQPFQPSGTPIQSSAYISFQTGATERLLIGNSGVVSVPGTFVTPTLKQTNAYSTRYTLTSNQSLAATTDTVLTSWSGSNTTTLGAPITVSNGVFTTTAAGVWSIQAHVRFNATAAENAVTLYSTGGSVFSNGTRIAIADNSVYDVCVAFTGYLASGDSFDVAAYSTIANSVTAATGSILTYIQMTLMQRCA